jgi:hypothetical protein
MILMVFVLALLIMNGQNSQAATISPPLSQPLVREGTFANELADALKVGRPTNETEAESLLSEAGIVPRNGWIADYPITPDIAGELQISISEAAKSGRISMSEDEALKAFQDILSKYDLSVTASISGQGAGEESAQNYPDSQVMSNYYYDEGPPVVTYYSPPPDYAYLYTWVPYPFWWSGFWFTGFFVLADFHVKVHRHGHDEFISNHFRDFRTGKISRIDAVNRSRAGTFVLSPGARGGMSRGPAVGARSGSTCSSCHYSAPSTSGRSSSSAGASRGSSVGGSRGPAGGNGGGFFGGGWKR